MVISPYVNQFQHGWTGLGDIKSDIYLDITSDVLFDAIVDRQCLTTLRLKHMLVWASTILPFKKAMSNLELKHNKDDPNLAQE